jgi:hypothetical protein
MSPKMKALLATGIALVGATAVGGVVAKQRFDAMAPGEQLDFANSMVGRTNWFPWLSGRIRGMRDAGIMRGLNDPNTTMTTAEKLALANRILATKDLSPNVRAAVIAQTNDGVRQGVTNLTQNAQRFIGGLGTRLRLGGGGMDALLRDVQRTNKHVQDSGTFSAAGPDRVPPPTR